MIVYKDKKGVYIPLVIKLYSREEAEIVWEALTYAAQRKAIRQETRELLDDIALVMNCYLNEEESEK